MGDCAKDNKESGTAASTIGDITTTAYQTPQNVENKARLRGRKGHTKSRTGCYNCKKARIKARSSCNE
jgi:hypothetical protein